MKYFQPLFFLLFLFTSSMDLLANHPPKPPTCACDPVADSLALVELYQNFDGANWTKKTNWLLPGQGIGTWYGVTLNQGCVRILNLANNQLNGILYDFNFPELIYLYLNGNQITGEIPDFQNLPKLRRLRLFNNPINGEITDFSNLPDLLEFELGYNQLSGEIPDFTNLPKLQKLVIDANFITGVIPDFSNLPELTSLTIGYTQITGGIPDFSNLPKLEVLSLYSNPNLIGEIPDFSNLPELTSLTIAFTLITGGIPDFSNLPKLEVISLYSNPNLIGEIPDFTNLSELRILELLINQLSGEIPDFSNLPNLVELWLDQNQLSGKLPDFQNLPNLEILSFGGNSIEGEIPDFSNLPKLEVIFGFFTELSGEIPDFSNIPNLYYLYLSYNKLSGDIPDFSNLPVLAYLYLEDNQLTSVPDFSNLPILNQLLLSSNQLASVPDFSNLPLLAVLYLDGNELTSVPNFSNLSFLSTLKINSNQLTSAPDISNLQGLYDLDLQSNQINGAIPDYSNLPNLNRLFLNDNQFTGVIPDFSNFDTFNISNNRFTFTEILASGNLSSPGFAYAPQKLFYQDTTFHILSNQPLEIDLGIDASLTDNFYTWQKDSLAWTPPPGNDPNSNKLLFPSPQAADAGRYYAAVTNPQAPDLTLYSHTINLQVCDEQSDSLELVSLYDATNGIEWTNQTNWLTPGMPIGTWFGVTPDAFGCVQKLDLTGNNLVGTLPPLNLNTLDTLILEDNQLSGIIPEVNIPFVSYLNLSRNQLTGNFPLALNSWLGIDGLDLSHNALSGIIVPDLGDLCELTGLHLNNNLFEGELPVQLTMLYNLQIGQVDFSNNLIDSLKQQIIWFCPYGDTILQVNPSYDRFLGICNVQCSGEEWENFDDFPWIPDTLETLDCTAPDCVLSTADAGFVEVRGVRVIFTRTRCYTQLGPPPVFTEEVRFYDCGGYLLETASCDQDEFCAIFSAISIEEFRNLEYDVRWSCGQNFGILDDVSEPARPASPNILTLRCSPNPADVLLFCENDEGILPNAVRVFDLLGRSQEVAVQVQPAQVQLDMGLLPPGIYIVTLQGEKARYVAKVVLE